MLDSQRASWRRIVLDLRKQCCQVLPSVAVQPDVRMAVLRLTKLAPCHANAHRQDISAPRPVISAPQQPQHYSQCAGRDQRLNEICIGKVRTVCRQIYQASINRHGKVPSKVKKPGDYRLLSPRLLQHVSSKHIPSAVMHRLLQRKTAKHQPVPRAALTPTTNDGSAGNKAMR